jgi:hypothetical protein
MGISYAGYSTGTRLRSYKSKFCAIFKLISSAKDGPASSKLILIYLAPTLTKTLAPLSPQGPQLRIFASPFIEDLQGHGILKATSNIYIYNPNIPSHSHELSAAIIVYTNIDIDVKMYIS